MSAVVKATRTASALYPSGSWTISWSGTAEPAGPAVPGAQQLELLRRIAHWSMKEPKLEEEALLADVRDGLAVRFTRRTMQDSAGPLQVTAPDGSISQVPLAADGPGRFVADWTAPEPGLYRLADGDMRRVLALGPAAPREFEETVADAPLLARLVEASGGSVQRLSDGVPDLRQTRAGRAASGDGLGGPWIGVTPHNAATVTGLDRRPLLPAWAWLALIAGLILIVLFSAAVLFQIVTLPVEFNASSRARRELGAMGIVPQAEVAGTEQTLRDLGFRIARIESPGTLDGGDGFVDLSHRGVVRVSGADRLTFLHSLTTQHLLDLQPGQGTTVLVLSPQGHLEHALYGVDDGTSFWAHTEPGAAAAAVAWLDRMRFMMRVEVADRTNDFAVVWSPEPVEGLLLVGAYREDDVDAAHPASAPLASSR